MRDFKYNVIDLISYVRDRPCLWDKTIENYKDRIERRSAWEEIFNNLEESYEDMTAEEKRITGDSIIKKWSNVRDSFMKSLRMKGYRKRYMYAPYLNFLSKNVEKTRTDYNCESDSSQSVSASLAPLSPSAQTPETPTSTPEPFLEFPPTVFLSSVNSNKGQSSQSSQTSLREKKQKRREPADNKKLVLEELKKKSRNDMQTRTRPNEKETMLLSFMPYIKDMNETEMMDLHMEMLTAIRKIKDKRAATSTPVIVNTAQLTSTPNIKPAIIKINPQKTLTFTFPNSQKAVNKAFSHYFDKA